MENEDAEGAITGRFKKPYFPKMMVVGATPRYLQEAMEFLEEYLEIPIEAMDFSSLEDRVLAHMVYFEGDKIIYQPIDLYKYSGLKPNLVIIDEIPPIMPADLICKKPVKQNGKDASYLALDPTKKHTRHKPR